MLRQDTAQRLLPFSVGELHHHLPHGCDQVWYSQSLVNFCFLEVVHHVCLSCLETNDLKRRRERAEMPRNSGLGKHIGNRGLDMNPHGIEDRNAIMYTIAQNQR